MFPEVRWVNGISGYNYINFAYHKALTFGLDSSIVTYFTVLGSESHLECQSSGVSDSYPKYSRTGCFPKLYIPLTHRSYVHKAKKKCLFFFFRKGSLHKTETWP